MENSHSRIDGLIREVQSLKMSLEFTQSQFDDYVKKNTNSTSAIQNRMSEFSTAIIDYSTTIKDVKDKLDDLENQSRRNNLLFEGIEEEPNETWEVAERKVFDLLSSKLQIDTNNFTIERAHRVGNNRLGSKPRAVIAKFANHKTCVAIMKGKKNLKGSDIFVQEDYSEEVLVKHRELSPQMYEARRNGMLAFLRYDKLITRSTNDYD